ncbi:DUF2837 family protein [Pseudoalteromonas sp. B131b]|uniref:hypothetical protein n=1 Tax=Pseudoalteromonas sp. B131b TaxID=630493 RepID=UPI00301E26C7
MVTYLFIIMALLFAIEASTALARKAGYLMEKPESGLILQSSLSLMSRLLIFMFMPLIGALSDKGSVYENISELLFGYLIIPFFLLAIYICRVKILTLYYILTTRMLSNGSFFKSVKLDKVATSLKIKKNKPIYKKFISLYMLVIIAYIPYYLAWPSIMVLIDIYPENRGFLLGMSSVLNGFNTIILTIFVDPKLVQIGKQKRLIINLYDDLILLRFVASLISFFILALSIFFLG